jgi:hypothetical protein
VFLTGSLVCIRKHDSMESVKGMPPGLVLRQYDGYPKDANFHENTRIVYDIYFRGKIEIAVDHEWLLFVNDPYTL